MHDMCFCIFEVCGLTYKVVVCFSVICIYTGHVHMHGYIIAVCHCMKFHVPTHANISTLCIQVSVYSLPKAGRQVDLPQASILPQCCQTKAPQRAETLGRQAH